MLLGFIKLLIGKSDDFLCVGIRFRTEFCNSKRDFHKEWFIGFSIKNRAGIFNVILGTILYQSIMTFTLPIANVIMPEGSLSEIVRIIIQNGIILYALTKAGESR